MLAGVRGGKRKGNLRPGFSQLGSIAGVQFSYITPTASWGKFTAGSLAFYEIVLAWKWTTSDDGGGWNMGTCVLTENIQAQERKWVIFDPDHPNDFIDANSIAVSEDGTVSFWKREGNRTEKKQNGEITYAQDTRSEIDCRSKLTATSDGTWPWKIKIQRKERRPERLFFN